MVGVEGVSDPPFTSIPTTLGSNIGFTEFAPPASALTLLSTLGSTSPTIPTPYGMAVFEDGLAGGYNVSLLGWDGKEVGEELQFGLGHHGMKSYGVAVLEETDEVVLVISFSYESTIVMGIQVSQNGTFVELWKHSGLLGATLDLDNNVVVEYSAKRIVIVDIKSGKQSASSPPIPGVDFSAFTGVPQISSSYYILVGYNGSAPGPVYGAVGHIVAFHKGTAEIAFVTVVPAPDEKNQYYVDYQMGLYSDTLLAVRYAFDVLADNSYSIGAAAFDVSPAGKGSIIFSKRFNPLALGSFGAGSVAFVSSAETRKDYVLSLAGIPLTKEDVFQLWDAATGDTEWSHFESQSSQLAQLDTFSQAGPSSVVSYDYTGKMTGISLKSGETYDVGQVTHTPPGYEFLSYYFFMGAQSAPDTSPSWAVVSAVLNDSPFLVFTTVLDQS